MNHKEFLNDLLSFYSADPVGRRAVDWNNGCKYRIFDDKDNVIKKCGIGRHIPDEYYEPRFDENNGIPCNMLPKYVLGEIKHLCIVFLRDCQALHDSASFWNENGLTRLGNREVEYLKDKASHWDKEYELEK